VGELRRQNLAYQVLIPKGISSDESQPDKSNEQCFGKSQAKAGFEVPHGMAVEMVEHYLDKVNTGRPHNLFHPATLRSQFRNGTIKKALLYAICAIGSKFSVNPDVREWEARLAAESKRLLQLDIENICLENVQACILISTMNVGSSNSSEALYFREYSGVVFDEPNHTLWWTNHLPGIAMTMADLLGLNSPSQGPSLVLSELKRRAWWSLYLADAWCVSSLGLSSQMKDTPILIDLPMDENVFFSLSLDQKTLDEPYKPGIFAQLITLSQIFGPIQDLNRRIALGETHTAQLDHQVVLLAKQLEDWRESLPANLQMSWENLHQQQEKGVGGSFVVFHLAYHHYATLLYFRFLEDRQNTCSTYQTYIKRCKMHASSFSALLRRSRLLKGCEPVFPLVGHMTTISSSVLLHTLLFGNTLELAEARQELNANFEALIELKQYWFGTSTMVSHIQRDWMYHSC
jgi:hypothetical protein